MAAPSGLPASFHVTSKVDFTKPIDKSKLQGRNVLVTGGASGIGLGCVTAFAEAGAYVTILDVNEAAGADTVTALKAKGYNVNFHKTDVTSWTSQVSGFKAALAFAPSRPNLDIVVASAGLPNTRISQYLATQSASLDQDPSLPNMSVLDVNLTGNIYTAHLALHYFKATLTKEGEEEQKQQDTHSPSLSKQLIMLCSTTGYTTTTEAADYAASKYGVRGLWKSIRFMPHILSPAPTSPDPNIPLFRTNLVVPTLISTPMTKHVEAMVRRVMEVGSVADVVEAVMRVAGDEEARGRAVCVPPGRTVPGDENFDLDDDWEGLEGGELVQRVNGGALKGLEFFAREV